MFLYSIVTLVAITILFLAQYSSVVTVEAVSEIKIDTNSFLWYAMPFSATLVILISFIEDEIIPKMAREVSNETN